MMTAGIGSSSLGTATLAHAPAARRAGRPRTLPEGLLLRVEAGVRLEADQRCLATIEGVVGTAAEADRVSPARR